MSTPVSMDLATLNRIFKRDDLRGVWPDDLNSDLAYLAGVALVELCGANVGQHYVIGHDARTGSYELLCAVSRGIESAGGRVVSLGLCSSEQVYYAAGAHGDVVTAGIMITASHNPKEYNGIKFVHGGALPFTASELASLKERMGALMNARKPVDTSEEYGSFVYDVSGMKSVVMPQGQKLKVVVCGGFGVGAVAFRHIGKLLEANGVEITYFEETPDGNFPKGVPNPLLPDYNARLGEAVRHCGADLGIGFDGDADRAGFVDGRGESLVPSFVLAVVANAKLASCDKATRPVVMGNICCSHLLKDLFAGRTDGVEFVETPVGHGQIKQLMRHPEFCKRIIFAGEHSGHYFYPEFFSVDSGVLTSLYMIQHAIRLKASGRVLSDTLDEWRRRYLWSGEINYRLPDVDRLQTALEAIRHFEDGASGRVRYELRKDPELGLPRSFPALEEGNAVLSFPDVKIEVSDGVGGGWWMVVRPSGNEPMLRLNIEVWGQGAEALARILNKAEETLLAFGAEKA